VTYPDQSQAATSYIKSLQDPILSNTNDVLMGFTFNPPTIDWTVAPKIEVCDPTGTFGCFTVAGAEAGFKFDAALGLRLPTEVTLNYPDQTDR